MYLYYSDGVLLEYNTYLVLKIKLSFMIIVYDEEPKFLTMVRHLNLSKSSISNIFV